VTFDATVDVLESLGTESFAYCRVPGGPLAARLDARSEIAAGDGATFWLDASALHLFAADADGRSLDTA
jgi:ABC-type sugar transport system ATPase subunit